MQTNALTIGQVYYISVDDDNTSGTFSLCLNDLADFDFKSGALTVATNWCSPDAAYDNTFATADQSQGSCWSGITNKNVWFKFNASTTFMKVSVKTGGGFGTMVRQQVALWDLAGSQIGCGRWVTNQGIVTLQTNSLTIGQDHWISVDDDLTSGTFSLCINCSPLGVNITSTNVTCFGLNNGTATGVPYGGTAPYTYLWTGPASFVSTISNITNLVPGTYNLKVTDFTGDFVNSSVVITQPVASLSVAIASQTNVSCTGGNNGSVTVLGSGGTPAYQYRIDAGAYQASGTFGTITAGNYTITVKDVNNCTSTVPVTITTLAVLPDHSSGLNLILPELYSPSEQQL